jgi:hypothetical protein
VTFEELVELVGPDRYRAACERAWNGPADEMWPDDLADVPHDIADLWDLDELPLAERLALALRAFREMPCYANAMYVKHAHDDLGPAERAMLWDAYRAALDSDREPLAAAAEYSLWVDFFEDPSTVEEAWREMTREPSERRLERLLESAGPVPWKLKEPLFEQLFRNPRWHPFIRAALAASANDVYGQDDPEAARAWRRRVG